MDTTTPTPPTVLGAYRAGLYACFTRARAALFDLCDALATHPGARSFVDLSPAPCFQRRWPSVYEAWEDGRIDRAALRALFRDAAPRPAAGARQVRALDSSPLARPYARTSADRTLVHGPAAGAVLPPHTAPVRPGWAVSTLVVVPPAPRSWTHILDNARIPSDQTALPVGAAQRAALVPTRAQEKEWEETQGEQERPVVLADGGAATGPPAGWRPRRTWPSPSWCARPPRACSTARPRPRPARRAARARTAPASRAPTPPRTGRPTLYGRAPTREGGRSRYGAGAGCTARSAGTSPSRRSASRARRPPARQATRANGGAAAGPCPRSPGWPACTRGASAASTATASTSRTSCGRRHTCAHRSKWNAGRTWSPPSTMRAGWPARAQAQHLPWADPPRPLSPRQVRRALARLIAREGTSAAPPRPAPPRPAPAGNPPAGRRGRSCAPPRAIRSSAQRPRGAPNAPAPPKTTPISPSLGSARHLSSPPGASLCPRLV